MNYIKLMRSLKDKSYYSKDSEKLHLWIHLLLTANWSDREEVLGGKPIICKAGQFTTGRKQLSKETGISESKIERLLTYFEKIEQQIEQQKTNTNRLISVLNWDKYQISEQPIKQRVNNKRTTSEQQVNTLQEYKEVKELKEENIESENVFNFQKSLINFGIEKTLVSEWLVIRKNKKLTNTQTSFNAIQREISKSNKTPNECIKIAVEKSWGGFEAAWLQNIKTNNNNKTGITNLTGDEVYEQF